MDAPSDQPPAAHSPLLRSATLASVTLLLNAKNLCELVGCFEEPGLERTATGDNAGKGSGLSQSGSPEDSPGDLDRKGHSGTERSEGDSVVKAGEKKAGLGAGERHIREQGSGRKGVNGARGQGDTDSLRTQAASCHGGAALALRLVERLLVEAVAPDWRGPQEGISELDDLEGGRFRAASEPVVPEGGETLTAETPDALGRSKGPVLSRGQLLELVRVHCVLMSFLRRAESESGEKAEVEMGGPWPSKSDSGSDIGFGLPTLLWILDYVEPSCRAPDLMRPTQLNASAQLAVLHVLSLVRGVLERVTSRSAQAPEVPGATLRDVGGLVRKAVALFKGSCLSALELAGHHAPTTESEAEPADEAGLLQSMPAALALARALRVDLMDLASVTAGRLDNEATEVYLEELEGVPRMGKALAGEEGVTSVAIGRSSLQLAALSALSLVFEWLEGHSASSIKSNERRGDGITGDGLESLSGLLPDSLAPAKQGAQSAAEQDALVAGCVSPDESAAAFLVARELVEADAAVGASGLEGAPNPLGQLLVYVAVILRLEMEAGVETPLLTAFCRLLTSLVRLYSGSHPPDGTLSLATGVARGLVASFNVPAGAPLHSLVALVLEHSPLEVAVSWAACAVSDRLGTTTGLAEDQKDTGLECLERAEKSSAELGSEAPWKGAAKRGMEGETDGGELVGGATKRGDLPPQESPNCEDAMLSWVEHGGLKTEVPELEDANGGGGVGAGSALPVVRSVTNGCRDQVLDLALAFLVRVVERGAGSHRDGGGQMGEGHVAANEGEHVELGLEPLTQIIAALTAVCDADVAVESTEELQESGVVGLIIERQGLRILDGVRAALSPVQEGVLWLSDLCESAFLEVGGPKDADGSKGTGSEPSEQHGREKLASGGSDVSEIDPPTARLPAGLGVQVRVSKGGLEEISSDRIETAEDGSVSGSGQGVPREEFPGDESAAMVGAKTAHERGAEAGNPDASQVETAAELVRLGVALHCAAERLVERKRKHWAAVAEYKALETSLMRCREHLEDLLAAYRACRKVRITFTGVLDCLALLCEDLGQTGFRVSDSGRLPTAEAQTVPPVTDAHETGREEATNLRGAVGLEANSEEASKPSGNETLDAAEKGSDAEKWGPDADEKGTDAEGVGSDVQEGGSHAKEVGSDARDAAKPAESAHRTRSGRKSTAPSAWWAVVDEEKGKQERGAKRKACESVRKRESAPEKRPKVAPGMEVALVEQGGEVAEIDLEEEERRNDRPSKRRRKMLAVKRRKAAARGPSQNKFVAYALEEQMLDSESEWDSDEYSDMEDFIELENEEVDFKTMQLSTITPYVPYAEQEEEAPALPELQEGSRVV